MRLRLRGKLVAALAATATVLGLAPAAHASPGWTVSYLPLPDGYPDARGYIAGTDGKGNYAGDLAIGDLSKIVTWTGDRITVHENPAGYEFLTGRDQNNAGTVVGTAIDYEAGDVARPFTLDNGIFRFLTLPDGVAGAFADKINNRGDILGTTGGRPNSFVVWPGHDRDRPVVVNHGLVDGSVADIDEDGTVLLYSPEGGPQLWKDGVLRRLTIPAGYSHANGTAIKNGTVVGFATVADQPGSQAFQWRTPDDPRPIPGGALAMKINSFGLIAGHEIVPGKPDGPLAAWLGTRSLGRLPIPAGQTGGAAGAIGDDGSIVGFVSDGPLDEGGRPVVWRYSLR